MINFLCAFSLDINELLELLFKTNSIFHFSPLNCHLFFSVLGESESFVKSAGLHKASQRGRHLKGKGKG